MQRIKFMIFTPLMFFLIYACTPWVSVAVEPENFPEVKAQFDTFIFGSYNIDADQGIYLDMKGAEPDLLLNRVYTHAFSPGLTDYFLIPVPAGNHFVKSIYFTSGPEYTVEDPEPYYPAWGWGWGFRHFRWYYYEPYPYVYSYNPVKIYHYPFAMTLNKNTIYYFGRIVLTNGRFLVENKFDEDKAALIESFQGSTKSYQLLSGSEFRNLLK
ncbi:MAG: hypothetical protein ABSG94_07330 [Brevinematales bacterium]